MVFLKLIAQTKETYDSENKHFLRQKLKKKETDTNDKPIFDPRDFLGTMKTQQVQNIKTNLGSESIPDHFVPRFYYQVIQLLLPNLASTDELLKSVLQ